MSKTEYHIIKEFINGTLDDKTRIIISEQIKKNQNNSDTTSMNSTIKTSFNPEDAWNKLHQKIEENQIQKNKQNRLFTIRNIAASILLIISFSTLGYFVYNELSRIEYAEINSGSELKELSLPDGSILTLNRNSSIKYPLKFSKSQRLVEFKGEAFFEITENPKKPFIIVTNNAEIRVLGTSFNVCSENQNNITVSVRSGKVQLSNKADKTIILTQNEVGKIENNFLTKGINSDKNFLSWKTNDFTYDGEKFNTVIQDLNKVYQTNIVFENETIGQKLITTQFQSKSLQTVLEIICTLYNLEFQITNDKIIISEKE